MQGIANLISEVKKPVTWVEKEFVRAYKAAAKAATTLGTEVNEPNLNALKEAEESLQEAEERLRGWVKGPEYRAWKRALSIWFGLLAGLIVAIFGDICMLSSVGVPTPKIVDLIVTGLVIGAGPGPMHSLIGIVQSTKEALAKLGEATKGKTIQASLDTLQDSIKNLPNRSG
jgi:hypothetical protein